MPDKRLPAETFRVILLPAETHNRNLSDSLGKKPFFADGSLGRQQEIADSLGQKPMTDSLGRKQKLSD